MELVHWCRCQSPQGRCCGLDSRQGHLEGPGWVGGWWQLAIGLTTGRWDDGPHQESQAYGGDVRGIMQYKGSLAMIWLTRWSKLGSAWAGRFWTLGNRKSTSLLASRLLSDKMFAANILSDSDRLPVEQMLFWEFQQCFNCIVLPSNIALGWQSLRHVPPGIPFPGLQWSNKQPPRRLQKKKHTCFLWKGHIWSSIFI